jgi:hypothetical protein
MMASGRAADREDPKKSRRTAARSLDRDPISELHHGQRSQAPQARAGHMTAPDHFAKGRTRHLRRRGPSTYDFCTTSRISALHQSVPPWVVPTDGRNHFDPLPPPALNGRCPFRQPTSTRASGNGKDAPKAALELGINGPWRSSRRNNARPQRGTLPRMKPLCQGPNTQTSANSPPSQWVVIPCGAGQQPRVRLEARTRAGAIACKLSSETLSTTDARSISALSLSRRLRKDAKASSRGAPRIKRRLSTQPPER